jgi:hypothetical protein
LVAQRLRLPNRPVRRYGDVGSVRQKGSSNARPQPAAYVRFSLASKGVPKVHGFGLPLHVDSISEFTIPLRQGRSARRCSGRCRTLGWGLVSSPVRPSVRVRVRRRNIQFCSRCSTAPSSMSPGISSRIENRKFRGLRPRNFRLPPSPLSASCSHRPSRFCAPVALPT